MKAGRNDPCPCGSEKKYKKCCYEKPDTGSDTVQHKSGPSLEEANALVALFAAGKYADVFTFAQQMTVNFPLHWFGWKLLGAALSRLGRSADALVPLQQAEALAPGDADAHYNLGITLQELNRLDDAAASYRRTLQINPAYLDAHYNLGNTLRDLERLSEAEICYRTALKINPDFVNAHHNLGSVLSALGRLDEAEVSCRQAITIRPDFAIAHNILGNILRDLGRLDEAAMSYRRALEIAPENAGVLNNLGNIYTDLGRLGEAEAHYRHALEIAPGRTDTLSNLARLMIEQGKPAEALHAIRQSLMINETEEAKWIFVACAKRLNFPPEDNQTRAYLVRALTEPWGMPNELMRTGTELVKRSPYIKKCIALSEHASPVRQSPQGVFKQIDLDALATDLLLCALLESAPMCDLEIEHFLTVARRELLETAATTNASTSNDFPLLPFYSALASQCFINEYVFLPTADELQKAGELRDLLVIALETEAPIPLLWPLAVATYFPLYGVPFGSRLLHRQWPKQVMSVLVQQICEPDNERALRATIPRLTSIDDGVSLAVQSQYEENPYPRWIKMAPACKGININAYMRQKFPLAPFARLDNNSGVRVLIAGCGTGQHAVMTAQQFRGAQVLAIDLSLGSLSYAQRKTTELGLTSIEYAQADLLKLAPTERSFDLVESVGVLHHLADPWAGWEVLLSQLRTGGLMRLGFYSEAARRNIVRIRKVIALQGYEATIEDIRQSRIELMDLDKTADFGTTLKSSDFFSISACRDLLFHVQEHCMTLIDIDAFLRKKNLVFLGFEIDEEVLRAYKRRFPEDPAATDLGLWQIFENENLNTFFGMYQFWIQKIV